MDLTHLQNSPLMTFPCIFISEMEPPDTVQGDKTEHEVCSGSEESIGDQGVTQNDVVIALDDIVLRDDAVQGDEQQGSQDEEMESVDAEGLIAERKEASLRAGEDEGDADIGDKESAALANNEQVMTEEACKSGEARSDDDDDVDEGIVLDEEELNDNGKHEMEEELNQADRTAAVEEGSYSVFFCSV